MKKGKKNPNCLTVVEHTRELRRRVVFVMAVFLSFFLCCYLNSGGLLGAAFQIGRSVGYRFVYVAPQEVLLQQLKISGIVSVFLVLPVAVWQMCVFVSPAFEGQKAGRSLAAMGAACIVMFVVGMAFAYRVLLPFVFKYLFGLGEASGVSAMVSVADYLSLFFTVVICIGIVFETPLVCIILDRAGIVTSEMMGRSRPVVFVFIFVVAAVITPPDVVSQVMVAVPMAVLFQASILLCGVFNRKDRKRGS